MLPPGKSDVDSPLVVAIDGRRKIAINGRRRPGEIRGVVRLLWRLNAFYCAFWHRLEVVDRDPLPTEGPAILISNHTCCIDHMLLQAATRRLLGFLIARELYDFWFFRPFCRVGGCIPVRRDGNDIAAMRAALRVLEEGRVVPIFPEGRILPTSGRELGEAKPGVAFIALRAGVPEGGGGVRAKRSPTALRTRTAAPTP